MYKRQVLDDLFACGRERLVMRRIRQRLIACKERLVLTQFGPVLRDLGPVSYTHLRAHETVLDLVCRLLLDTNTDYICTYVGRLSIIHTALTTTRTETIQL